MQYILDDKELPETVIPVFINEAAYIEKGIAMSLTVKEQLIFQKSWAQDLINLISR